MLNALIRWSVRYRFTYNVMYVDFVCFHLFVCSSSLTFALSIESHVDYVRLIRIYCLSDIIYLQTVSIRRSDPPPPPPFRKEIETLTHYTLVRLCNSTYSSTSSPSVVAAVQRTATYLSPLDARYVSLMANATAVDTLPVDVRTYQLVFSQLP